MIFKSSMTQRDPGVEYLKNAANSMCRRSDGLRLVKARPKKMRLIRRFIRSASDST